MTETDDFRFELSRLLNAAMSKCGISFHSTGQTLDYLQGLARKNGITKIADITPEVELAWSLRLQKTAGLEQDSDLANRLPQFGPVDIIAYSLKRIINTAIVKAASEDRTVLQQSDIEHGFLFNDCKVPPFCKGR